MTQKKEASLELLFDEVEPYFRLFACLIFIYLGLRVCRAIGMQSIIFDWMERADLVFTGLSFGVFLLDRVMGLVVNLYTKWMSGPPQENG
jgi:hypothetical protein